MPGILGKKIGMTRIIADDGSVIPVSVVECTPNEVIQVKTAETDGYPAVVLGFDALKKEKKTRKYRFASEFTLDDGAEAKKGDSVNVESFADLDSVKVTGWAKGKGFAGVIKRHNFSRGPETHGSHHHRQPGSNGGTVTGTGRTPKGKRFPGHMGTQRVTSRTKLVRVDAEKNLLIVKGPVPGAAGDLIKISA